MKKNLFIVRADFLESLWHLHLHLYLYLYCGRIYCILIAIAARDFTRIGWEKSVLVGRADFFGIFLLGGHFGKVERHSPAEEGGMSEVDLHLDFTLVHIAYLPSYHTYISFYRLSQDYCV